jgi:hypothetical protein
VGFDFGWLEHLSRGCFLRLDRTLAPLVCSVRFRPCPNGNCRVVKTVMLRGLALLGRGYEGLSAPRMLGFRGSTLVRDTGAETPCSNCTTNNALPGSSSTSATTAGNQHPSHTHTGSCRLICACDGSILSSVPERTAGKKYWQVALRNIAQRRPESKLRRLEGIGISAARPNSGSRKASRR